MANNNITGDKHTRKILTSIAKFGSLTTKEIASLVYSDKKEKQRLANRKLDNLETRGLIVSKKLIGIKNHCHQLKKEGAVLVDTKPTDSILSSSSFSYTHRLKINEIVFPFYIQLEKYPTIKLLTEYEIQTGYQEDFLTRFSKVPDSLLGNEQSCIWWEVEMSRKGTRAKRAFCLAMLNLAVKQHFIPGISNDQHPKTLVKPRIISAAKDKSLRLSVIKTIVQTFVDVIQEYDDYNREAKELENIEIWIASGKGFLRLNLLEILKNRYLFLAKLENIGK